MKMLISALILVTSSIVAGQRPSFAGTKPIGFPDTPNRTTTTPDPLVDRFGEGTPERLPIEANGDRDLIDRLSKLPIDKQPFWYINWQAYEQHRKEPQTYPQRPSVFADPIPLSGSSGSVNNGFTTPSSGFIGTESTVVFNRFGSTKAPSQLSSNVGSNSNLNSGGNSYPSVYPDLNVFPSSNANLNSNVYPTGNNANYQIYPTENGNGNPNLNQYPNSNTSPNNNPTTYPNSNAFPNRYTNPNNYPTGNFNTYPAGGSNPNGNPNFNFNTQSSKFNTQTGTTKNGVSYFQTTQKYQWNTAWNTTSTNVGTTNLNQKPEYYPRTDTYPQRPVHELF